MDSWNKYQFSTNAIHAGFKHDDVTGAIMPPITLSTTFAQSQPGHPLGKYEYTRTQNPNRDFLEKTLAVLEKGQFGLCFASGSAALSTLIMALPKDSHIILSNDVYGGTLRIFDKVFSEHNMTYSLCDLTHPENMAKLINSQTKLIWLETPSNPLLKIIDIAAIKQQAPQVLVGVDNTFATPYLQNPLNLGADLVCHSSTKYIGGHSDVLGGALILNDKALMEKLAFLQNAIGAVPSPFDCFLLLRSLKTLALRMKAHCHNAMLIAEFLSGHPQVKKLYYPGLKSHPQHQLAKKQMRDFGGMLSVEFKKALKPLQLFTLAESLGGIESLFEYPDKMTHVGMGIDPSLVRFSIGIEDPEDLIKDLNEALK